MYFGLQVGALNTMSTSTALLAFAIFRSTSRWLPFDFTPTENVIVQTIASSIAGMPVAASLTSAIPAFEFLRKPDEGGPRHFAIAELMVWSLGVSLFGTVLARPSRADADKRGFNLVDADADTIGDGDEDADVEAEHALDNADEVVDDNGAQLYREYDWASKVKIIVYAFSGAAVYVFASFFFPILSKLPIFGIAASEEWLWFLTLSPALTAFGMILDLPVAFSMLFGAVLGWGILSPLAKGNIWTPGGVGDMETGARGWLLWISVSFLLGDAVVRHDNGGSTKPSDSDTAGQLISSQAIFVSMVISTSLCLVCTLGVFGKEISFQLVILAVAIAFPLCVIIMQSVGETDTAPTMSLSNVCQFLFVLLLYQGPRNSLMTMAAGAVTEAGLWQSAVLMTDLKTAYLVQASPKVMFRAQLLGSVIGAFIGSGIYRLFTAVYTIPSPNFSAPLAYMWSNTARLADGGSLPKEVWPFMLLAFTASACLRILGLVAGTRRWSIWVPSGVSISIGMYVTPSITLARLAGAAIRIFGIHYWGLSEVSLMSAAAGCILGESMLGFVPQIIGAL
ncbi:OPT oligopeptide transporter protein-domain-containing protein [Dichotomopilus funicola]|uniref:OPT oligopeptide transporter protein-domain-containing protein n=1 Tax=Dichotomopilus funicola TaxID=1934379 RepID=A0AAN6V9L2_9PEZI|nr:OPT oligopeptide transporter protein-domain-containing protein [Dichotomopilus funicola]